MKKITLLFVTLMSVMSINADTFLKGSFNSWGDSNKFTNDEAIITLNANTTYEFKIVDNGTWYGNNGTMSSSNCSNWTFSTSAGNAKITTTISGEYKFTWDSSTKKVSVTYPTEEVVISYYITGTSNLVGGSGWQANEKKMTENNGTYTYTFSDLDAGNYEFKITNGTWDFSAGYSDLSDAYQNVTNNSDNNVILNLEKTTTITITFDGSKISLNLPQKRYTVYFVNDKNWKSVNVYLWNDSENNTWPGKAMTKIEGKTYKNKVVYEYTFHPKFTKIIFNNGSSQTSDLTVTEGKLYYYDNKWNETINYDVTISVTAGEGGTVKGGGTYEHGATATLTATAKEGYDFLGWYDEDDKQVSTAATYKPTVTSNLNLTAKFQIKSYTITVTAGEGGTVSGGGTYNHGATATLTATPNDGYKFVEWNDENTDNPREITVTSNATYTATFEKPFSDPSTLEIGETYGKLSYELTMPQNRWYWIVLPYNVNVSEIKTSTDGGWNDLVFTEYNAQRRAEGKNGWINWKTEYTNEGKDVPTQLQANKGYVIGPKNDPFDQDGDFVVTFPSVSTTNTVAGEIDLTATNTGGTTIDDNWNIIGTGLYHEGSLSNNINYVAIPDNAGDYNYYYISSPIDDLKQLTSFAPFEAFFVQYGGTYSATANVATTSAELAPVARAKAQEQEQIYLINMNEAHTVVILNAEGSEGYTAGEDFLEMNIGSRIEMIYSFDAEDALAFNHRATEAQSIALGGYVAVAGEQTISLDAYNGNAEAVTLIDNVTGTTTDLLAEDYTFTAEVGSLDGRFTIVFAAQKAGSDTTVDCYNSIANQVIAYGTADHCTVSGLTAGKAIVVYNTMGQLVFATTADSETITLPSLTAGNYLILHNGTTNKVTLR